MPQGLTKASVDMPDLKSSLGMTEGDEDFVPLQVPAGGTSWPLFLLGAAINITLPDGSMGVRIIQACRIAPHPYVARDWFIDQMKQGMPPHAVCDLAVMQVPREALMEALTLSNHHQELMM